MLATTAATGYFGVEASTDRSATLELTVAVILGSITFAIIWLTVGLGDIRLIAIDGVGRV